MSCWHEDRTKRPTAAEVHALFFKLRNPWADDGDDDTGADTEGGGADRAFLQHTYDPKRRGTKKPSVSSRPKKENSAAAAASTPARQQPQVCMTHRSAKYRHHRFPPPPPFGSPFCLRLPFFPPCCLSFPFLPQAPSSEPASLLKTKQPLLPHACSRVASCISTSRSQPCASLCASPIQTHKDGGQRVHRLYSSHTSPGLKRPPRA